CYTTDSARVDFNLVPATAQRTILTPFGFVLNRWFLARVAREAWNSRLLIPRPSARVRCANYIGLERGLLCPQHRSRLDEHFLSLELPSPSPEVAGKRRFLPCWSSRNSSSTQKTSLELSENYAGPLRTRMSTS